MDSSFSMDENGNRDVPFKVPASIPNATSTARKPPKKTDNSVYKYKCEHCGKGYQVGHYYRLHLEKQHGQVTTADPNVSSAVHLDCSDISFSQLRDGTPSTSNSVFKQPSAPAKASKKKVTNSKTKKKPTLTCTYCLKGYVDSRSYKQHIRAHHIETAAARFPDAAKIIENSVDIADKTLLSVARSPSVGDSGARFKHLVGHIASVAAGEEWKTFCNHFSVFFHLHWPLR